MKSLNNSYILNSIILSKLNSLLISYYYMT